MLRPYPSVLFGLETAFAQLDAGGRWALSATPFAHGEEAIPINGLVWMGTFEGDVRPTGGEAPRRFPLRQNWKIGAIDFDRELDLVRHIRDHFTPEQIELRVDANGGFTPDNALD